MKVLVIIPYFGKLPALFQDFLNSCSYNEQFDWLIVTDDQTKFIYPRNVKVQYDTFLNFVSKIQSKFDFKIEIKRPHKLCDFKVAYGYIFEKEIADYDYWGHGDLDVIYGDLSKFITPLMSKGYDKIYSLGHLSLYKNNDAVNSAFKSEINGEMIYKKIFSNDFGFAFDEWHCSIGGINQIFENANFKFFKYNHCANLDSHFNGFKLSNYIINFGNYVSDYNSYNIFQFKNGKLFRYFLNFNKLQVQEYPYIHFHKRNILRKSTDFKNFIIIPNYIIRNQKVTIDDVRRLSKVSVINYQFFKVKYINIKYRLRQLIR